MKQQAMPLNLIDLVPQEAKFVLPSMPALTLTLCKFNLLIREKVINKYGHERLEKILRDIQIIEVTDICWLMLKEKDAFNNDRDTFFENISGVGDQLAIYKALMKTIGIGEPEYEKLEKALLPPDTPIKPETAAPDPKPQAPKKKTGAKSLTK